MKCPYCEQEIADQSAVCPVCGRALGTEAENQSTADTAAEVKESIPEESTAEASQPESPKNGRKKWMIPAAGAAVIAVAAGAFAMKNTKDPKDAVIDAFKSITAEGQTSPMKEIFGVGEQTEGQNGTSGEMNLELTMEGISDLSMSQLATGKVGMNVLSDMENNKISITAGVGYADMDLASLELYADENQIIAAVPELSSKAFVLNYSDDLEGQLANSPYLGAMIQANGIDLTGLNAYMEKVQEIGTSRQELFDVKELWKRYKEGSQAIDDLKAAMTVEKTEKKDFTIDGASESCSGYHVTVSRDALIQFITTTKDFFLNDETLKSDFIEYMSMVSELQGTMVMFDSMATESPEEMQQKMWQEAETQINTVLEQLKDTMGDVTMNVYVRKDGRMGGFDYETSVTLDNEAARLFGDVSFGGGYNMLSNVAASLNIENEGETVTLLLDKTGAYEPGKSWTAGLNGSVANGDETYEFAYEGSYGVEDGTYDLSLDLLSSGNSIVKFTSNGYVNQLEKGKSIDLSMDSIRVDITSDTTTDYVELSGKYYAGPLEQAVEAPEGESFDILAATEADYNGVISEMSGNIFALMMKLYQ